MSIPYLVHKEDADRFDQRRDACEPWKTKYEQLDPYRTTGCAATDEEIKAFEDFKKEYQAFYDSFGSIRVIRAFAPAPPDPENYYTYYRGYRWGEANGPMMGIAYAGIAECKKAITGK